MHKDEASRLFASLGDPNRVKIVKMLYHNSTLSVERLSQMMDLSSLELKAQLNVLIEVGLVKKQNEDYCCDKELLDTLLS
ncbi:MAG: helix-turn-helix domain-containing protein, partial [Anaeroplasmataceae bacterium]|nr:helix-turn-helix domain-containing protein [Anaeroplasmataceae bacterium]